MRIEWYLFSYSSLFYFSSKFCFRLFFFSKEWVSKHHQIEEALFLLLQPHVQNLLWLISWWAGPIHVTIRPQGPLYVFLSWGDRGEVWGSWRAACGMEVQTSNHGRRMRSEHHWQARGTHQLVIMGWMSSCSVWWRWLLFCKLYYFVLLRNVSLEWHLHEHNFWCSNRLGLAISNGLCGCEWAW